MSYREENGQVILTVSREDYELMLMLLGMATSHYMNGFGRTALNTTLVFMNRLNSGNPDYTPYPVEECKS